MESPDSVWSNNVWADGEWKSWAYFVHQFYSGELKKTYPKPSVELVELFQDILDIARIYHDTTGRYLPVFGELGELFAEITFGIKRNKPNAPGSDGRKGNDLVEIKTITPKKKAKRVSVKRKGNFNKLIVVNIDEKWEFEARMIDRKKLKKGSEKLATVSWSSMNSYLDNRQSKILF